MKYIELELVDSTNEYIKREMKTLENYTVVRALYQTSGKGRQGHTWDSMANENLLVSLLLKEDLDPLKLSQVMALSLSKMLSTYGINGLIKWPNDLYVNGEKIAGILVETCYEKTLQGIIIGVGLNVNETNHIAMSRLLGRKLEVMEVMNNILNQFNHYLLLYKQGEFNDLLEEINQLSYLKGKKIEYGDYGKVEFLRLDEACQVIMKDEKGDMHHLMVNEISLGKI